MDICALGVCSIRETRPRRCFRPRTRDWTEEATVLAELSVARCETGGVLSSGETTEEAGEDERSEWDMIVSLHM